MQDLAASWLSVGNRIVIPCSACRLGQFHQIPIVAENHRGSSGIDVCFHRSKGTICRLNLYPQQLLESSFRQHVTVLLDGGSKQIGGGLGMRR